MSSSFALAQPPAPNGLSLAILSISEDGTSDIQDHAHSLSNRVLGEGHRLAAVKTVANQDDLIRAQVQQWIDSGEVDAILSIDRSIFSPGEIPPSIILGEDHQHGPTYSLVLNDGEYGFVGIVDIRAARARFRG